MFSKLLAFFYVLAVSSLLVAAGGSCTTTTVSAAPTATTVAQCDLSTSGPALCCEGTETAESYGTLLLGLLGITALDPTTLLVGLVCTPIIPLVSPICTNQQVCCTDNDFTGLVNVGCVNVA